MLFFLLRAIGAKNLHKSDRKYYTVYTRPLLQHLLLRFVATRFVGLHVYVGRVSSGRHARIIPSIASRVDGGVEHFRINAPGDIPILHLRAWGSLSRWNKKVLGLLGNLAIGIRLLISWILLSPPFIAGVFLVFGTRIELAFQVGVSFILDQSRRVEVAAVAQTLLYGPYSDRL